MKKNWNIAKPDTSVQSELSKKLSVNPLIAQILINRGLGKLEDAQYFLNADISSLHDPFKLRDMLKSTERIKKAIEDKEKILIVADYDADGVTSCAVLKLALLRLNAQVTHYIPHRIKEGYGLNENIVKFAKKENIKLLITVDSGISAYKEVELLNKNNIATIVIDHHRPSRDVLPAAFAIIDPKRKDCSYPCEDLAAVGLAYKVAQALLGEEVTEYLDLVSLGTIADVMSLKGENRILVKEGIKQINLLKRKGINALIDSCKLNGKSILPKFVSFILGPRINASGRVASAEHSLQLLLTDNAQEACDLASQLGKYNRQRQKIGNQVLAEAIDLVEREVNFKDHRVIVVSKDGWHKGVLGIVASRIADRFYRPAIVISTENGMGKGSARSIDKFHIFEALSQCSGLLEDFGGHNYAAGLAILKENINDFRESINHFAKETLPDDALSPSLDIDAQIPLSELNMDLVCEIENLQPFGAGNPYPIFCSRDLKIKTKPTIVGKDTIKFWVTDGTLTCCVVGFGMGDIFQTVSAADSLDIAYSPSVDNWSHPAMIQLELKDIKAA